jgi:ribose transport system substrate-binding protein
MQRRVGQPIRVMAATLLGGFMGAFGLVTTQTGPAAADDKPTKIYLEVGSTSSEYWQEVVWGAQQVGKSVGASVEVLESGWDGQKHLQQIGAILASGCDSCVVVTFPDSPAFTKVLVDRVAQVGLPTTTLWNRPEDIHPWDTDPKYWVANISFDGVDSGYQNGKALCKALNGKGNIGVLIGVADNPPSKQRFAGLQKAMKECPGLRIADSQVGNWGQTEGQNITRTWLARYGDQLNGIFSENDGMAIGAVAALREKGLNGKIPVTGSDGSSDVLKLIQSGDMLSSMRISSYLHGAVSTALAYAATVHDIDVSKLTHAQRDFYLEQTLATKANVDAILSSKPDPAQFTYQAIMSDLWKHMASEIPVGANE